MLLISLLETIPEKAKEATDLAKNPKISQGIIIKEIFGVFGKPDIVIVFEAPSERVAAQFVLQFSSVATTKTQLVFPIKLIEEF